MTETTVLASQDRPTRMARASRVCSSTMFNNFSLRRSAVSSNWKSRAHTWFGRLRPQQLAATGWAGPLAPARGRPAQALLTPQALRPLSIDGPALPAKDGVGGLPAPPGVRPGDGSQPPSELVLLGRAGTAHQALGGAVLAGHPTGTALGDPEALRQDHHGPTTALRG